MKKYDLIGVDGNAFSIMRYVSSCMRKENLEKCEIDEYFAQAMSSDYSNLLRVSVKVINKINEENNEVVEAAYLSGFEPSSADLSVNEEKEEASRFLINEIRH